MEPYFFQLFRDFFSEFHVEKSISIGDILAFCSIMIAIYQFSKQMTASRKEHEQSQKEDWFLNVIVLPELNSIKVFYDSLITDITRRKNILLSLRQTNGYSVMLSRNQTEIIDKISKYFIKLINLVRSYNTKLSDTLDNHVDKLQDICTDLLSNDNDYSSTEIRRLIMDHEGILMRLLNKGLSNNK